VNSSVRLGKYLRRREPLLLESAARLALSWGYVGRAWPTAIGRIVTQINPRTKTMIFSGRSVTLAEHMPDHTQIDDPRTRGWAVCGGSTMSTQKWSLSRRTAVCQERFFAKALRVPDYEVPLELPGLRRGFDVDIALELFRRERSRGDDLRARKL
jgi:hypothetical protein